LFEAAEAPAALSAERSGKIGFEIANFACLGASLISRCYFLFLFTSFCDKVAVREKMRNSTRFFTFVCFLCGVLWACGAPAVVEIKKAAVVAEQPQEKGLGGLLSGNSLIPTAIGLIGKVRSLQQQQQALTKECEPTDSEISFVKTLMQEWARAGGTPPAMGSRAACDTMNSTYAADVMNGLGEGMQPCYQRFRSSADINQIYYNYPYPGKGSMAKDISAPKSDKNSIVMSDLYDMLGVITFDDADLLPGEASQMARLREKAIKCAPDKLNARQRELWGGMLTDVVGSLGQKQNATTTMSQVTGVLQNSGGNPLGSVMNVLPGLAGSLMGGQ
jgi:hypothetical protein